MTSETKVLSPSAKPPLSGASPAESPGGNSPSSGVTGYAARYAARKTQNQVFEDNFTFDGRPRTAPQMEASISLDMTSMKQALEYTGDMAYTRLRKPQPVIGKDFAGMSTRAPKWSGKFTPYKGHGIPQEVGQEFSEKEYLRTMATRRRICPTSHSMNTIYARDILGANKYSGVEDEDLSHTGRRIFPDAEIMFRHGSTNTFDGEEEKWKKARGWGQPGKHYKVPTGSRVLGLGEGLTVKEIDPSFKVQSIRCENPFPTPVEHDNVLKYRYSGGISFNKYEFDPTRAIESVQHKEAVSGGRAKGQWHGNYDNFQMYRARMNAPSTIFAEPLYEKRPPTAPAAPPAAAQASQPASAPRSEAAGDA